MSNQKLTLTYLDEEDRAYGLAGMIISLAALDAIENIASVSMDAKGPMVTFSDDFYFTGAPNVSAKATWNILVHNYYITSAMVVANLMSRSLVRKGEGVPLDLERKVRAEISNEGRDTCSLEEDEIEMRYRKIESEMYRIFSNHMLRPAIHKFVTTLTARRTLTGNEILSELHSLHII